MTSWVTIVTRLALQCRARRAVRAGASPVRLRLIGQSLQRSHRAAPTWTWGSSPRAALHGTARTSPGLRRSSRCWTTATARPCSCTSCGRWAARRCWSSGSPAAASRRFPRARPAGASNWPKPCIAATCPSAAAALCPARSRPRPGAPCETPFSGCSWTPACLRRRMRRCRPCYRTACSRCFSGQTCIWNTLRLSSHHETTRQHCKDARPRPQRGWSLRKRPSLPTVQPIRSVQTIGSAGETQWEQVRWSESSCPLTSVFPRQTAHVSSTPQSTRRETHTPAAHTREWNEFIQKHTTCLCFKSVFVLMDRWRWRHTPSQLNWPDVCRSCRDTQWVPAAQSVYCVFNPEWVIASYPVLTGRGHGFQRHLADGGQWLWHHQHMWR